MEEKKVLLSIHDLEVKFRVRGRILTAIRGVDLDIYENESIAIVGESGSGKSVFTKTFAGMLDSNGFINRGSILFSDEELADTTVAMNRNGWKWVRSAHKKLNKHSKLELGAHIYRQILEMKEEKKNRESISGDEKKELESAIADLNFRRVEASNLKLTVDPKDKQQIKELSAEIKSLEHQIKVLEKEKEDRIKACAAEAKRDTEYRNAYTERLRQLQAEYREAISGEISEETSARNEILAREIYLSVGRFNFRTRYRNFRKLLSAFKKAMTLGIDLNDENARNGVFDTVVFRVRYLDETERTLHGTSILNLAKVKYSKDWTQVRGGKIATVFQDPMTSLNPIITIGKQITSVILKHQKCSESEARERALILMKKVGIPNAENRFDDYPFQYSGGMRQRIVIAIALSCQPKILICDEPTTALDVTIQAQILRLLKSLQKEFGFTIVFITHDLGVVANIADRVAVMYAGQIVELGNVDDVFYDPRHPYTWALLSSLPQLAQRNTKLYSITGTPPSLYNEIVGDPFAPRNPYCLKIDTLMDAPMFRVSDTHFAKTWMLDPRAPKAEKPEIIQNIHEKLMRAFNI
ncbi:MAG: ATP-binding cassette domain-containing protein [Ruminococcaceae bacterium]|nr:ATP-binding cassette domain-containing protein [Oscillospiraceae bacterium]